MKKLHQIFEKKLTPAEIDKREEIALAIEREHPEMDKAKKMAIATSKAKQLVEDFIELHPSLLTEEVLMEDRLDFLKQNVKDKVDFDHDPAGKIKDSDSLVDHIAAKVDPTAQKVHTQWVVGQYRKGNIRQEDFPRVKKALKGFELTKKHLEVKDLNQFSHVADLEDHVATQKGRVEQEIKEKAVASQQDTKGLEKVHESSHGVGFKVPTRAASVSNYGAAGKMAQTHWCTAANSQNNMFSHYSRQSPLFTYHTAEGNVLQFHHSSGQIMDKNDRGVDLNNDSRFAPHSEDIKDFIRKTHEGSSSLKDKLGIGRSKEEWKQEEDRLVGSINREGKLPYAEPGKHDNAPYSADTFGKIMSHIEHNPEDFRNSTYMNSLAKNPYVPSHIHDRLFAHVAPTSDSYEHRSVIENLAGNNSVQGETREKLKEKDPTHFAYRRDLSDSEIEHFAKETPNHLAANTNVTLPEHIQRAMVKSGIRSVLNRPDVHQDLADENHTEVHESNLSDKFLMKAVKDPGSYPSKIATYHREAYSREGIPSDVHEHIAGTGSIPTADIRKEHVDIAVNSGKYSADRILGIKGISKEQADKAASEIDTNSSYSMSTAFAHPKVSASIKDSLIRKIAKAGTPSHALDTDYGYFGSLVKNMAKEHITSAIETGSISAKKSLLLNAKNIQKSHFDALADDPKMHSSIVASKSAPPSVLAKVASITKSDFIKSAIKKHKNASQELKDSIKVEEE